MLKKSSAFLRAQVQVTFPVLLKLPIQPPRPGSIVRLKFALTFLKKSPPQFSPEKMRLVVFWRAKKERHFLRRLVKPFGLRKFSSSFPAKLYE